MSYLEYHELPIYFRTGTGRIGKIIEIQPRTRCTRRYIIRWANQSGIEAWKGARSRPWWIKHIYSKKELEEVMKLFGEVLK